MSTQGRRAFTWILVLVVPCYIVATVLVNPVEEYAEDAAYLHIYRAMVFSAARSDGWLYPRWAPSLNGGLGSPLFTFYSPGLYYVMDFIHRLGFAHTEAWRITIALFFLVAMSGAFALGLAVFRRADAALVGATAYAYAPYLLQDLLQRGSPEGLAISLAPWVFLGLLRLAERPSGLRLALASLAWAFMVLMHSLMALLFAPLMALFTLYLAVRHGRKVILWAVAALALGTLLVSFHFVPFLHEVQYVHFAKVTEPLWAQPAAQPLMLDEFMSPPPVFDVGLGNNTMMNHRVSWLQALMLAMGVAMLPLLWRLRRRSDLFLAGGVLAAAAMLIWLQTGYATWVWSLLRPLKVLQFRWRLLGLVGLAVSIVAGYLVAMTPMRGRRTLVALACAALVAIQIPSLYPQLLPRFAQLDAAADGEEMTEITLDQGSPDLTALGEFVPRWREWPFSAEETKWVWLTPVANLPDGARLISDERRTGWIKARIESPVPFAASMHLLYYPGWIAYVDGVQQMPRPAPDSGYATVDVAAGQHTIEFRYEGTLTQHLAALLSAIAVALLGILIVVLRVPSSYSSPATRREGEPPVAYLTPGWVIPALLVLSAVLKAWWIDPHTTLFRYNSTPQAIAGAGVLTDVHFGDSLQLCGYTLPRTVYHPGEVVQITFYWLRDQPMANPRADSFVHLLGTTLNGWNENYLWGQQDKIELPGGWGTDKLYRRVCRFRIQPDAPPGSYQLEIGWRSPEDNQLLPPAIIKGSDRLAASESGFLLLSGLEIR